MTTVPESEATLRAQQRQLVDGNRAVQMFPRGTKELPLPRGMRRLAVKSGDVFHFDPRKISAAEIRHASAGGNENRILGLGPFNKADVGARIAAGENPMAVTERTQDRTEVRAAAATNSTAPTQVAAMRDGATPGNTLEVEPIGRVLHDRLSRKGRTRIADDDEILRRYGIPQDEVAKMSTKEKKKVVEEATRNGLAVSAEEPDNDATPEAPIEVKNQADLHRAEERVHPAPSAAQAEAENYRHGHIEIPALGLHGPHGISIETAAGGTRNGPLDKKTGEPSWSAKMAASYGRIKGTKGADGEPLDVFVGDHPEHTSYALVIDQHDPKTKKFDEHKITVGFRRPSDGLDAYLKSHDEKAAERIGGVRVFSAPEFMEWLKNGDKSKPASLASQSNGTTHVKTLPVHHEAIASALRKNGIDPGKVRHEDLHEAAQIHAGEGAPPEHAFVTAVFRSLARDGHVDPEIENKERGDEKDTDANILATGAAPEHGEASSQASAGASR